MIIIIISVFIFDKSPLLIFVNNKKFQIKCRLCIKICQTKPENLRKSKHDTNQNIAEIIFVKIKRFIYVEEF